MVLASEWLEKYYPNKELRKYVDEIYINKQLTGELDLSDFSYLHLRIYFCSQFNNNQFQIVNQPPETEIVQSKDASEWLEQNYSSRRSFFD